MEYVVLTGLPLLNDLETTREAVRVSCARFGEVGDVVVNRAGGLASVGFLDPTSAQDAILTLNGAVFHDCVLHAHVAPPPRTWLPGYIVTTQASRTVLVEDESYLRVAVIVRRFACVTSLTSVRYNACLVVLKTAADGVLVKRRLSARLNRRGKPVSAIFLRKG